MTENEPPIEPDETELPQPPHVLLFEDDGDGWTEPFIENWRCSCGAILSEWVQTERDCLDRPYREDIFLHYAQHVEEAYRLLYYNTTPTNETAESFMEENLTPTLSIVIYGASDDLIEIDGDVSLEGSALYSDPTIIHINGKPAVTAEYRRDGLWSITPTADLPEGIQIRSVPAVGEDERYHPETDYAGHSELLYLTGPIWSIVVPNDEWERKN